MNTFLKFFLFLATTLFGFLFFYTFQSPEKIEQNASFFIKYQLKKELKKKIDSFESNKTILNKFTKKLANEEKIKLKIYQSIEKSIPIIVSKMQDKNCECREQYKNFVSNIIESKIGNLKNSINKLNDFLKYKYMEVVKNLIFDIRVFLASNLLIFLTLLIFLFVKPKANIQILFVCSLLIVSSLISSYFYIFEQNWFFTIIYNDYVGYFYILYVAMIFFFLWDILLNKAKYTTKIVNTILDLLGSSFTAVAC